MSLSESKVGATLAVSDLQRARSFYEEKLGLTAQVDMGGDGGEGAVVYGAGGDTTLFVYTSAYAGTNQATAATWEVGDIDATVEELAAKGIEFERYPEIAEVDERGIHEIGDGGRGVWFKDPDGNIISVGQFS
jgi:catechol 2,3-dioxygenase-like lactoylglutathione lyase family enzyme